MISAAYARLSDLPDRDFGAEYWTVPGGPTIYAYVSRTTPMMVAIDLLDVPGDKVLKSVVSQMREQRAPFRDVRDIRSGHHGRFLVAIVGA